MAKLHRFVVLLSALFITGGALHKPTNANHLYDLDKTANPAVETVPLEVNKQIKCLAMNIYQEAGNQSSDGKLAVAQVTLNRVNHEQFPNDICSVVHQRTKIGGKTVCQFSWYCSKEVKSRPIHPELYKESVQVAKQVLLKNKRFPKLKNALFYHADYTNPNWKLEKIAKIGNHIFYKPRSARY